MVVKGLDKECYFGKKNKAKCHTCKKEITPKNSVVGYGLLFCKECYKKFNKQAIEEVGRALKELEKSGYW